MTGEVWTYRFVRVSFFFFSSRRRHTRCSRDWSSDVCSSDLVHAPSSQGPPDGLFGAGQLVPIPVANVPRVFHQRKTSPAWRALLPACSNVRKPSRVTPAKPNRVAAGLADSQGGRQ